MGVFHRFVSSKADGADATLVRPSSWNELHAVDLHFSSPGPGRIGTAANRWYGAGVANATPKTTGAPTAGRIRTLPFVADRDMLMEGIAVNVTTGLAGNARLGIYADDGNLYPGALLYGSADVATGTAGVKSFTGLNVQLRGGDLYWAAYHSSAAVTIRTLALAGCWALLGSDATLPVAPGVGWDVAQTYGALPDPYPAGAAQMVAIPIPAIFVRGG